MPVCLHFFLNCLSKLNEYFSNSQINTALCHVYGMFLLQKLKMLYPVMLQSTLSPNKNVHLFIF